MQKARRHSVTGTPTACRQTVSGTISLICSRFFSPFPHGTGSLSVSWEYLALRDGPRRFSQDFTCPAILRIPLGFSKDSCTGLSPSMTAFSKAFHFLRFMPLLWSYNPHIAWTTWVWAVARSLATTCAITVVFSSCGYLDVSVPRVCLPHKGMSEPLLTGCPIRISSDQGLFAPPRSFSQLITSFVASKSQGIHRLPLLSLFFARLLWLFRKIQNSALYSFDQMLIYWK